MARDAVYAVFSRHYIALDAASGAERWRFQATDPLEGRPVVAHGTLYAATPRALIALR